MGGVKLKDLKDHTNAVGGFWGTDSWAGLVRNDIKTDFEEDQKQTKTSGLD